MVDNGWIDNMKDYGSWMIDDSGVDVGGGGNDDGDDEDACGNDKYYNGDDHDQ